MNTCIAARKLVFSAAVVVVFVAIGLGFWATNSTDNAEAAPTDLTVGLDMKSSAASAGTYNISSLPTFEQCVDVDSSVDSGFFYLDVFILNVTNLIAFNVDIDFTTGTMQIMEADVRQILGTGTSVQNFSRNYNAALDAMVPPVNDGIFYATALDTGGADSGSGVLARIKGQAFSIGGGSVVSFELNINPATDRGVTLTDSAANHPGDTGSDGLFDGPFINQTGTIAVDQPDGDSDGVSNTCDNCPSTSNAAQTDTDGNGVGDACDGDDDGDGVPDGSDNCPTVYNPTQDPSACADSDGDGVLDGNDNCPTVSNANQADIDGDGTGDACDTDNDNDGVPDVSDNCPFAPNPGQENWDGDALGDACEDSDNDGWIDSLDNCKSLANPSQSNFDGDSYGNICDNCPNTPGAGQEDVDGDFLGDVCDDSDSDGFMDNIEVFTGTDWDQACASTTIKGDEDPDLTPTDTNDDQIVNSFDLIPFIGNLNTAAPGPPYAARLDFTANGTINSFDLIPFIGNLNTTCVP